LNDIIKPFSIVNCYYYRNSKMHIIKQLYSNIQNIQNKFIIAIKNKNYNMDNINKLTKKRINILRYNELSQELANQISILIDVDDTRIEFYIPIYIMSFKQYIQGQKKDRNTYSVRTMKEFRSLDIFKVLLSLIDVDVNIPKNTDKFMGPYLCNQFRYCQHNFTVSRDEFKAITTLDYNEFKNVIESQIVNLRYIKGFLKLLVQRINEYYAEKSIIIEKQLRVLHKKCQSIKNNLEFNAIGGHDVGSIIDSINNYLTEVNDGAAKNTEYTEDDEGDKEVENNEYVENVEDIKDQRIPNPKVINQEMLLHQWLLQKIVTNQEVANQEMSVDQTVPNQIVPNHLFIQNHEVLPEANINFGANVIPDQSFTLLGQPLTAIPEQTVPLSEQPPTTTLQAQSLTAIPGQTVPLSEQPPTTTLQAQSLTAIPGQTVPLLEQPLTTALQGLPLTAIPGQTVPLSEQPLTTTLQAQSLTALPGQTVPLLEQSPATALQGQSLTALPEQTVPLLEQPLTTAIPGTNVIHGVNGVNEISEAIGNNRGIKQFDPYQGDQFDLIQLLQIFRGDQNNKNILNILAENNHLGSQFVENAGIVGNTSGIPEEVVNMDDQFHQNQIARCYQFFDFDLAAQCQPHQLPVAQCQPQQLPVAQCQHQQLLAAQCQHQQLLAAQCQHHQLPATQYQYQQLPETQYQQLDNEPKIKPRDEPGFESRFESRFESTKNEFRSIQYFTL